MVRFSALLVMVGFGLLIAGGVTSRLLLIYIAIGVAAVALLFLIIGAIVKRAEFFGQEPEGIGAGPAGHGGYADELAATPEPAAEAVGSTRSSGRNAGRDHAEAVSSGTAPAPERARETAFPDELVYRASGKAPPGRSFAGYEQFARDAERREPGSSRDGHPPRPESPFTPQRPFVEPEPTRMDWAADLREAERQERERQGQGPERPQRPEGRPDGGRLGQSRPGPGLPQRPFVEPEPTRMDWAAGLREAEQKDRDRQDQRSGGSGHRAEPSQAEATRDERVSAEVTRDEPGPVQATRAEKVMTARPDGEAAPRPPSEPEGPAAGSGRAGVQEPAVPVPDPSSTAEDAAEAKRPAELSPADRVDSPAEETATLADAGQLSTASVPAPAGSGGHARPDTAPAVNNPAPPPASASGAGPGSGADADADAGADADQQITVVPGVPRYHRSDCILIRFMGAGDLQRMPVQQAREAGCTPCRACQPDGEQDDD